MKKLSFIIICVIIALFILINNKLINENSLDDMKKVNTATKELSTEYKEKNTEIFNTLETETSTKNNLEYSTELRTEITSQKETETTIKPISINLNDDLYGENENLIYSFKLKNSNKKVTVAESKAKDYLICRIGTKNNIEFEFPDDKTNSYKKFLYSYYSRGGGVENLGLSYNNLHFKYNDLIYSIYSQYSMVTEKVTIYYNIENPNLDSDNDGINDTECFYGNVNSVKGSLNKLHYTEVRKDPYGSAYYE